MAKHSNEDPRRQQDSNSAATTLPADQLEQAEAADELEAPGEIKRREERHRPQSLEEENIGLDHLSGVDEAEIGRELNVSGREDDGEDEDGNPVDPDSPADHTG